MGGDPSAVGPREYGVLVLGALSYTCYTFTWFSLPAVLSTLIEELGLTTTEAGLLVGAVPLVYVPLGLASGLVIDRIGPGSASGRRSWSSASPSSPAGSPSTSSRS